MAYRNCFLWKLFYLITCWFIDTPKLAVVQEYTVYICLETPDFHFYTYSMWVKKRFLLTSSSHLSSKDVNDCKDLPSFNAKQLLIFYRLACVKRKEKCRANYRGCQIVSIELPKFVQSYLCSPSSQNTAIWRTWADIILGP